MAAPKTHEEIEAQVLALQAKTKSLEADVPEEDKVGLGSGGHFDTDIYDNPKSKFHGYVRSIATTEEAEDEDDEPGAPSIQLGKKSSYTAPLNLLNDLSREEKEHDPMAELRAPRISDREDEYKQRRRQQIISPERHDPFAGA